MKDYILYIKTPISKRIFLHKLKRKGYSFKNKMNTNFIVVNPRNKYAYSVCWYILNLLHDWVKTYMVIKLD